MYKFEMSYIVKKSHRVVVDGRVITVIDDLEPIDISIVFEKNGKING